MSTFIEEARRVLHEQGIDPGATLDASGVLVRCGTTGKPTGKDAAYTLHMDECPVIWWQNWRTGESGTHSSKTESTMTPAERKELRARIEAAQKARAAEEARRHAEAAAKAVAIWNGSTDADDTHPYLVRKGIPALGVRLARDGRLIVPVLNAAGALQNLQFIDGAGEKRPIFGGKVKGCFFSIPARDGSKSDPLLIGEGYATVVSLHLSTGYACLAAFNCGNLLLVARMAREHYPEREIILCSDNDVATPGNPGVTQATKAALAIGAKLAVPPAHEGRGTDFNDLHQLRGLDAVAACVKEAALPTPTLESEESGQPTGNPAASILPPPPAVPLEAFPPQIQALLQEAADAFTIPTQVPATVLLALLSCLVGRTRAIEVKPGWREHGNIWLVLVAPSGLGKTPVSHAFFKPIEEREYRLFLEWKQAAEKYAQEVQDFNKAKKDERGAPPPMPPRVQHYIDDATVEALADALSQNPRGVMWRVDELSGLLASFDKYSSSNREGGTRARLLSAHDCQGWKSNRRDASRNLHIPAACVSIFGGLQPGMMGRTFDGGDQDSGFLPRFMFVRSEREKPALWNESSLTAASEILLRQVVDALASFRLVQRDDGQEVPLVVSMTQEAKAAFVAWYDALALEGWACLTEGTTEAILQKLKSHALRLCLLLHCLDAALEWEDASRPVAGDTMNRVLLLADWIKAHQRQVWKLFTSEQARTSNPIERAVMEAVLADEPAIMEAGGRITNAQLVELVNARLPVAVRPELVGKAASALGMPTAYIGKERARKVTPEILTLFKTTVGTVGAVGHPTGVRVYSHRQLENPLSVPSVAVGASSLPTDSANSCQKTCRPPQTLAYQGSPTAPTAPTVPETGRSGSDSSLAALAADYGFAYDPATDEVTL